MATRKTKRTNRRRTNQATPAPTPTPTPTPSAEELLRTEQLELSVKSQRIDLARKERDEQNATANAKLDKRARTAATKKQEADLVMTERALAVALADDKWHAEYSFVQPVTWDTAKDAIADLNKLSRLNPGKAITVTVNSPGGSVIAGLALYDHIRDLSARGHHMTVKVRGMAASMGGILLQAGDTRVVGPEAMVLIHEVASGAAGKVSEMEEQLQFSKQLWVKLANILAKRSKMTSEQVMEKAHKLDWWLDAEEAVRLGFADKIG
jgi:ATP-dependent Clp endopeptidase proteolytic subunit ClpP